jgi:transmembrane sensor
VPILCEDKPLIDVVNEINRYTSLTIEIFDPALKTLKVGGRFKVSDIEGIFDVLEANFDIQVGRLGDRHIQLRPAEKN